MITSSCQKMKQRSDLHLPRKFWHVGGVLTIALIFSQVSRATALQIMAVVTSLFVINDLVRHQVPQLNSILMSVFRPIMREYERDHLAGTSYLLVGAFTIMIFFPPEIVTLALLFLAVGDPAASYFGIRYGRDKLIGHKSLQGSLAAFVLCTIIAALYYSFHQIMTERLLIVSLLSGLAAALAELIPVKNLDDNLTFPILSSILLWGLFYIFGGFGIHQF